VTIQGKGLKGTCHFDCVMHFFRQWVHRTHIRLRRGRDAGEPDQDRLKLGRPRAPRQRPGL
jgi:hypothetical protein